MVAAETICKALNPDAIIHKVTRCDVPLDEVLGVMRGAGKAVEDAAPAAFFAPTLARPAPSTPRRTSTSAAGPLAGALCRGGRGRGASPEAYRLEGSLWLAAAAERAYAWSQAGGARGASPAGPCGIWAGAPRTQLAFVGAPGTDFEAIDAALDGVPAGRPRARLVRRMTPDDEQRGWNFPCAHERVGLCSFGACSTWIWARVVATAYVCRLQ